MATKKKVAKAAKKQSARPITKTAPGETKTVKVGNGIVLKNLDLTVDYVGRSAAPKQYDMLVRVAMPGTNKNAAQYQINIGPFMHKNNLKFQQMAIATAKAQGRKPATVYAFFDNKDFTDYNIPLPRTDGSYKTISSKAHVAKIFKAFGQEMPKKSDEVVELLFRLKPVSGSSEPKAMQVCEVTLLRSIANADKKQPVK